MAKNVYLRDQAQQQRWPCEEAGCGRWAYHRCPACKKYRCGWHFGTNNVCQSCLNGHSNHHNSRTDSH